jgi:hypothetical protein
MRRLIALALAATVWTIPVRAQTVRYLSGNQLYDICRGFGLDGKPTDPPGVWLLLCIGYLEAVAEATAWENVPYRACLPPNNVEAWQLMDIAIQYLQKHPEQRHSAGSSLVARALSEAFPCQ